MDEYRALLDNAAEERAHGLIKAWREEGHQEVANMRQKFAGAFDAGWRARDEGRPNAHDLPHEPDGLDALVNDAFSAGYDFRDMNPPPN